MKSMKTVLKTYYRLAKPGIVYGNSLAAIGGFLLAAQGHPNLVTFTGMLVGLGLVIGSACVFNNYLDRGIDQKMMRTKKRSLVTGEVSGRAALLYGSLLGLLGALFLALGTNWLALATALFGHVMYVVVYGWAKRTTMYGTEVGSISGAVPPVVGYVAVTGRYDLAALILFALLVFWQMPHFYAIALFRLKDYTAARIPVLPAKKGVLRTKISMIVYIALFFVAAVCLTGFGFAGYSFLAVMSVLSLWWLVASVRGFAEPDTVRWARQLFGKSLVVLLVLCVLLSVEAWLP